MAELSKLLSDEKNSVESLRRSTVDKNFVTSIFSVGEAGVNIVNHPLKITSESYGEAWIVGSSTNGLVGVNTSTQSGLQQVVGGSGRVESTLKVVNPGNVFVERFRFSQFASGGSASWNTATGTLSFTSGQAYTSTEIYKDTANVNVATFNVTSTDNSAFTASLKTSSGGSWETVTIGSEHSFTTAGTSLFWKLEAGTAVTVNQIRINYN